MAKLFLIFLRIIIGVINAILLPINSLISSNFPDFSNLVYTFNNILTTHVVGTLSFFSSLIPPITKSVLLFYFNVLIWGYGIVYSLHLILKGILIIKKSKFW